MSEGNGQNPETIETTGKAVTEEAANARAQEAVGEAARTGGAASALGEARKIDPERCKAVVRATIHERWRLGLPEGGITAEAWPYVFAWLALMYRQGYEQASADALRMLSEEKPKASTEKPAAAP